MDNSWKSMTAAALRTPEHGTSRINVGRKERIVSAIGGGLLVVYGITRGSLGGVAAAAAGAVLLYRGSTGHCPAFSLMGIDTSELGETATPLHIEESITVNKPRGDLYAYWRDVEHLPRFMHHLETVKHIDERYSHWEARLPRNMGTVSWEAEVIRDNPGEEISWRSLPGSDVDHAGVVRFKDAPGGRGTEVDVTISYRAPAGYVGASVASLLAPAFSQVVREDIRRFKNLMEAGEIPTSDGQPTG